MQRHVEDRDEKLESEMTRLEREVFAFERGLLCGMFKHAVKESENV